MATFDKLENLPADNKATLMALILKLSAFSFSGTFISLETGPVVSTYRIQPTPQSLYSKIVNRAEDIAMSLGSDSVLISRARSFVDFAIANPSREIISFDQSLYSLAQQYRRGHMTLPILMGASTSGQNTILDLATQPHMLIAGSTGSGKSVFLSEIICSLSLTIEPTELKMYLIDTKQLDLTLFERLPHVRQVIDSVLEAHNLLDSLILEVRKRTEKMRGVARNLTEYNSWLASQNKFALSHIVLVIDELADVIGLDLELKKDEDKDSQRTRFSEKLKNLAQISRAAGIHIIAATQRPSVKIISGDIKANFPTRVCFKLPTAADSRVVLDEGGAEFLLGRGDYLYTHAEQSGIQRAHSAFVSMTDIERCVTQNMYIRESFKNI
jgi:S-DNA-T family DNA segregation ATPase FtsK/SpoIIIE